MSSKSRKVAVLGAGPVGLEAALALRQEGHDVEVYERGRVAESVRQWGHIKLFSPWSLKVSERGLVALREVGAAAPDGGAFPSGAQYVEEYLEPLSRHASLEGRLHTQTRVVEVGRAGVLKGELIGSQRRRERPFQLLLEDASGAERLATAEVVVDTTGCWTNPNNLGTGGIPALGERAAAARGQIRYAIPDCLGSDEADFAGKHVAVVGAGYSAITTLNALVQLAQRAPETRITWLTRGGAEPYARIADDPLPERDSLSELGNTLAKGAGGVDHVSGVNVLGVGEDGSGKMTLKLAALGEERCVEAVDLVVANVGFHPDVGLYRELQVHQCYASEGPMKLAAALLGASGGGGDCLAQTSMGADTLKSPEPDFYILGSKSYGRNSAFLIKLGLEQIEDLKALLAAS